MYAFSFLIHFQERFKIEMRFRWKRAQRTVCVWTEGLNILYVSFKRKRNSLPTAPKWLILRYINSDYCVFTDELIMSLKQVYRGKKVSLFFLIKGVLDFCIHENGMLYRRCRGNGRDPHSGLMIFAQRELFLYNKLSIIINFYAAELLYLRLGWDRQRATKGPHKMTKPWERGSMFFK